MKPTTDNSGLDASPASQLDVPEAVLSRSSSLKPLGNSQRSARIEDIIGAVPKSVRDTSATSPTGVIEPAFWTEIGDCRPNTDSLDEMLAAVAVVVQKYLPATFAGWYVPEHKSGAAINPLQPLLSSDQPAPDDAAAQTIARQCAQALREHKSAAFPLATSFTDAICCPVSEDIGCLVVLLTRQQVSVAHQLQCSAIEFTAARISEWYGRQRALRAERESHHVAALIELLGRLASYDKLPGALQCLADQLRSYLKADAVFVGICPNKGPECRLRAVSDCPAVDPLAASTQAAEAALQESLIRGSVSIWPSADSGHRHALMCHQQFASVHGADEVLTCPLRTGDNLSVGALLVVFKSEHNSADDIQRSAVASAQRFLRASERPLATAVLSLQRSTQSAVRRLLARIGTEVKSHRNRVVAAVSVLFAAVLMIPVDYKVHCQSELQPVSRRFVAAPFDSPLKECLVEPGDVVEADQLLARLDGRELRWELGGIKADLGKATREYDAFLSEQEFGKAAIARYEMERLQNRSELLLDRTRSLTVKSPIAGIVVAGDLKDSEGVPLETGQTLFEVAPLDEMVVEIAIPEDDVRHVRAGMTVRLTLDALPSEKVEATIAKVHPRAELRDHDNVFIAEAQISNSERKLRPGMRGSSDVSTGTRTLGWNLFHKPVAAALGWLGW